MTFDTRWKWLLIAATALIAVVLSNRLGLSFPIRDLVEPCAIVGGLSLVAWFYRRRQYESFVATATALMQLVAYSTCFTIAMYAVAAIGRPLIDGPCMSLDATCGVSLPAIVEWAAQHPHVRQWLMWAYQTMLPQTALVIALLGLTDRTRELEGFLRQFMIASMIVLLMFAFFPAAGPFRGYGFEPAPDQARYLAHFDALRSGERTLITWRDAEGLITFPSFHTAWAILLAFAVRRNRWVFGPSLLLNAAVITATLTTGWHYFADLLSGTATAVVAIGLSAAFEACGACGLRAMTAQWSSPIADYRKRHLC